MAHSKRTAKQLKAANDAVNYIGGPSKGARLIQHVTGKKVSPVSVHNWKKTGIPPDRADLIYSICGIPPWITNPDVFPKRLALIGYLGQPAVKEKADRFAKRGYPKQS